MGKALAALQRTTETIEDDASASARRRINRGFRELAREIADILGEVDLAHLEKEFENFLVKYATALAKGQAHAIMVYSSGTSARDSVVNDKDKLRGLVGHLEEGSSKAIHTLQALKQNNFNLLNVGKEGCGELVNYYQGSSGWYWSDDEKSAIVRPWQAKGRQAIGSLSFLTKSRVAYMGHGIEVLYDTNVPLRNFRYLAQVSAFERLLDRESKLIDGALYFEEYPGPFDRRKTTPAGPEHAL